MSRYQQDLVNETVVTTPKPTASSTVNRKEIRRNIDRKYKPIEINYSHTSDEGDSLGLLRLDDVDLTPELEKPQRDEDVLARLRRERLLAQTTLNKAANKLGLPSKFLTCSDTPRSVTQTNLGYESTVNESDLLKQIKSLIDVQDTSGFTPNNMSTPRCSDATEVTPQTAGGKLSLSMYETMSKMSEKLRNSDISLQEMCSEFSKFNFGNISTSQQLEEFDSAMFTPAEMADEKLLKDELSWRKAKDLPVENSMKDSLSSVSQNSVGYTEKFSVGDFFKGKSEAVTNSFFKTSPERRDPVPLIDVTNTLSEIGSENSVLTNTFSEEAGELSLLSSTNMSKSGAVDFKDDSLLSISQIAKVIASVDPEATPTKVVGYLMGKKNEKLGENISRQLDSYRTGNESRYLQRGSISASLSDSCLIPQKDVPDIQPSKESILNEGGNKKQNYGRMSQSFQSVTNKENLTDCGGNDHMQQKRKYGRHSENYNLSENRHLNTYGYPNKYKSCLQLNHDENQLIRQVQPKSTPKQRSLDPPTNVHKHTNTTGDSDSSDDRSLANSASGSKENLTQADRSMTSVRSGSSLDTLPDGKFPIKSTRSELIWGCLRLGKSSTQEFFIRNRLNQRIRMQASVTGSSFRILKDRSDTEMLTSLIFVLHAMETKSFYVMFCPTTIGASVEKLNFYPVISGEVQYTKRQMMGLYGYGGHSSIDINNVAKDSTGKLWLSLGSLEHKSVVTQTFTIKNTGALAAFACLDVSSKGLYSFSVLYVHPSEFVIKSQEEVKITLSYTPAKQDFRNVTNTEVLEVGAVKVISGAEALRGRLRRLCAKLKQRNESIDQLVLRLSKEFPYENMPSDLRLFKETVGVTNELVQQLVFKEIVITVEQDPDRTLVGQIDVIDESSIYQTLCYNETNVSVVENETIRRVNGHEFKVEPTNILLMPPIKVEDTIMLHSESSNPMPFEIVVQPHNIFQVSPHVGIILPGETVLINVMCKNVSPSGKDTGNVMVYVENDVMDVSIKSIFVKKKQT